MEPIVIKQNKFQSVKIRYAENSLCMVQGNLGTKNDTIIFLRDSIPAVLSALSSFVGEQKEEENKKDLIDAIYPIASDLYKQRVLKEILKQFTVIKKP